MAGGDGGGGGRTVSIHRLVQDAQRRRVEQAGAAVRLLSVVLEEAMPGIKQGMSCTGEAMERFRRLRPHVIAVSQQGGVGGGAAARAREVWSLLDTAATALRASGEYAAAEAVWREVLEATRDVLGPRHPDTLTNMHNLASTLRIRQARRGGGDEARGAGGEARRAGAAPP